MSLRSTRLLSRLPQRLQHKCYSIPPNIKSQCAVRRPHLQHGSRTRQPLRCTSFHTTTFRTAQSPTADALMENLNDLYSTARDEFEIAAEETEKKTVYAADDREAAKAALGTLKNAFEKAIKESDPEVAKEVQSRTGQRIRELENAVTAMEEMALED